MQGSELSRDSEYPLMAISSLMAFGVRSQMACHRNARRSTMPPGAPILLNLNK